MPVYFLVLRDSFKIKTFNSTIEISVGSLLWILLSCGCSLNKGCFMNDDIKWQLVLTLQIVTSF